jgi:hypothetical protein
LGGISTGGARLAVDFHHPFGVFPPVEHDLRWIYTTLAGNFHRYRTTLIFYIVAESNIFTC